METTWKTFYLKVLSAFPALSFSFREMSVLAKQMQLEIKQQTTKQRGDTTKKTRGPIICATTKAANNTESWKTEAANLVTNASRKKPKNNPENKKARQPQSQKTLMYLRLSGQCSGRGGKLCSRRCWWWLISWDRIYHISMSSFHS